MLYTCLPVFFLFIPPVVWPDFYPSTGKLDVLVDRSLTGPCASGCTALASKPPSPSWERSGRACGGAYGGSERQTLRGWRSRWEAFLGVTSVSGGVNPCESDSKVGLAKKKLRIDFERAWERNPFFSS